MAAGKAPEYTEEDMVFDAAALSEEPKVRGREGRAGAVSTVLLRAVARRGRRTSRIATASLVQAASKKGQTAEEKKEGKKEGGKTTAVYVQGLPDDATEEELAQVFSRCGIIKEDEDRTPKVKVRRRRVGRGAKVRGKGWGEE